MSTDLIIHTFLVFFLQFINIFFSMCYYALIIWVVLSWVVLFRGMRPDNPGFILFSQVVQPILRPFRWARVGMMDFSPIMAILAFSFLQDFAQKFIIQFL